MKKVLKYVCEVCGREYLNEKDADYCEALHVTKDSLTITDLVFDDYEKRNQHLPNTIVIGAFDKTYYYDKR